MNLVGNIGYYATTNFVAYTAEYWQPNQVGYETLKIHKCFYETLKETVLKTEMFEV
jgi:hypothetical protein